MVQTIQPDSFDESVKPARKTGSILQTTQASGGRRRIENIILGEVREDLRKEYVGHITLLKYWRDQASHGKTSGIKDNEAYTSLALLLRLAIFVNDAWGELTAK